MGEALIARRGGGGVEWTPVVVMCNSSSSYATVPDNGRYMAVLVHDVTGNTGSVPMYVAEIENYTILSLKCIKWGQTGFVELTPTSSSKIYTDESKPTRVYFVGHSSGDHFYLFAPV